MADTLGEVSPCRGLGISLRESINATGAGRLERWIQLAGLVQLGIASANIVAARLFRYRESLASVPLVVRNVFVVQNAFIVLILIGISLLCLVFPADLAGRTALGRAISGFLAVFWALRLAAQLFYYSAAKKRDYPIWNVLFILVFVYLTIVFALAALR